MLAGEELFTEPVILDHGFWLCCVYTLLSHDTIYMYRPPSIPGPVQPGYKRKGSQFVPTLLSPGGYANFCPNSLKHKKPPFLPSTCIVVWGATPLPDGENSPCKDFYCQNLAMQSLHKLPL